MDKPTAEFKHINYEVHILNEPKPEIFMINLQYSDYNSSPEDVLSLLLSVAETFCPPDLYNAVGQKKHPKTTFILKGMVCFNGGHYVTYIHNILSKLDYVLDPRDPNASF